MRVKRLKFNWLTAVALVLVAVTVTALIGNVSGGFQKGVSEWKIREVNKENLYQSLTFSNTKENPWPAGEDGISIDLKENNVIKVRGTAQKLIELNIGSVKLDGGKSYVFDSSLTNGSNGTMYMSVVNASTGTVIKSSYASPVLILASDISESGEDTEVYIRLTIKADTEVNESLLPVLCVGSSTEDVIDFYK